MRSRDLIDGFNYGEYMQRQMFCFGSDDDGGDDDSGSSYGGGLDFSGEEGDDFSSGSYGNDDGSLGSYGGDSSNDFYTDPGISVSDIDVANALTNAQINKAVDNVKSILSRAVKKDYGTSDPTKEQIEQARGFDFGSDASKALEAQITGGYGGTILGDQYAGSGYENQMFFDQLPGRLANAQAGYGLPGLLGAGLGAIGTGMLNTMKGQVLGGGIPAFDATGTFKGVFSKGPFGFDVYTGMPIEGNTMTGWSPDDDQRDDGTQTVKPVNPVTGQCDAGYIFDEDLQACRLDTRGRAGAPAPGGVGSVVPPTPGGYARMGLLDVAPTGLPQFQQQYGAGFGTPQDFAAANLNFRRQGATYPQYFQRPPQLSGYTLLS